MPSPRYKNSVLFVLAVEHAHVRVINEQGLPLQEVRYVGKDSTGKILPAGQLIPYHAHYIARLKEGSLLAVDAATAQLAGTAFYV